MHAVTISNTADLFYNIIIDDAFPWYNTAHPQISKQFDKYDNFHFTEIA